MSDIEEKVRLAREMVSELNAGPIHGGRGWRMSIPAQDDDPDVVIVGALDAQAEAIRNLRTALGEAEALVIAHEGRIERLTQGAFRNAEDERLYREEQEHLARHGWANAPRTIPTLPVNGKPARMTIDDVLARSYDQERNIRVESFWDGGWTARFGDDMNGFHGPTLQADTLGELADLIDASERPGRPEGVIRCLDCGYQYVEASLDWKCGRCGGPVSQKAGTIVVGRTPPKRGTDE